ncbi:CRADD protein, partial [Trogon melanurus]|nr:CRADD protein [Trogon melanurus]
APMDEKETLLAVQQELTEEQFQTFKYLLGGRLPGSKLQPATRLELCRLLLQHFPGQALELSAHLLARVGRRDLLRRYQLPGAEEEPPVGDVTASSSAAPRRLSERDLLLVAQQLGKEWQEVGIGFLGLPRSRLEQIREDEPHNVVMQSFQMLRDWQHREGEGATAPRLHACLAPARLDPKVLEFLQSL